MSGPATYQPEVIVTKAGAQASLALDGTWQICINAMQRHYIKAAGHSVCDGWLVTLHGEAARQWWQTFGAQLHSGRVLRLTLDGPCAIRAHLDGRYGSARVHARCASVEILPVRFHQDHTPPPGASRMTDPNAHRSGIVAPRNIAPMIIEASALAWLAPQHHPSEGHYLGCARCAHGATGDNEHAAQTCLHPLAVQASGPQGQLTQQARGASGHCGAQAVQHEYQRGQAERGIA